MKEQLKIYTEKMEDYLRLSAEDHELAHAYADDLLVKVIREYAIHTGTEADVDALLDTYNGMNKYYS